MATKKAAKAANQNDSTNLNNSLENDKRFILFPLSLLKDLCFSEFGFAKIIRYGIYHYAQTLPLDDIPDEAIFDEAIQVYDEDMERLTPEVLSAMEGESGCFDDLDDDDKEAMNEWFVVHRALKKLGIDGWPDAVINTAKNIERKEGEPLIMVGVDFLFQAREMVSDEKKRMAIALLFGIKSIIGKNRCWAATTKEMMCARMVGALRPDCIDYKMSNVLAKWSSRRRFDTLKEWLITHKFLETIVGVPALRRTFVSYQPLDKIKDEIRSFLHSRNNKKAERDNRQLITELMR